MDKLIGIVVVMGIAAYVLDNYWRLILTIAILGAIGLAVFFIGRYFQRRQEYEEVSKSFDIPGARALLDPVAKKWDVPYKALTPVVDLYEHHRRHRLKDWQDSFARPKLMSETFEGFLISAKDRVRVAGLLQKWATDLASDVASIMRLQAAIPPAGIVYEEQVADPAAYIETILTWPSEADRRHLPHVSGEDVCQWTGFNGRLGFQKIELNEDVRFEHQWVVAPSGAGKTTLLQTQIADDLERVARGECSVIVIDSQNQLIQTIARCALFAPGQPLHGKLVLLEPDPDYPPALNVLDVGTSELNDRERFIAQAEAIENVKSCLSTMNDMQDDLLSYMVEFCFVIPGATIQTLVDLLKPNGLQQYARHLSKVDQTCRDFFETSFDGPMSRATKEAVSRRLLGMLRNPTFRRMFLNSQSRFSMARELREPKVILINTDLNYLKKDACQLFGRFFIAQLLQAAGSRGASSLPVFCYVDECHDYIADDENAAVLMDKARKRKVGMVFAHQRMANIRSANVIDALSNVGVRMAGGNETDAAFLSRVLRCPPEFIRDMERGRFAFFARRQTPHGAIEIHVPPNALESLGQMSERDHQALTLEMRRRFAAPSTIEHPREEQDPRPAEIPPQNDNEPDWNTLGEDVAPPQRATAIKRRVPSRTPPPTRSADAPGRGAREAAPSVKRRQKADAPDTTGSKPTAEW
jgi:hypothetical protein